MAAVLGSVCLALLGYAIVRVDVFPGAPEDRLSAPASLSDGQTPVVAVIGTSLTASSTWPETLQTRLEDCIGRRVHLENLAQNAATSELGLLELDTLVALEPSVVVMEFAINDADRRIGVSLAESRRRHETIIRAIQERSPETAIYLMTTNGVRGWMHLRRPLLPAYYSTYRDFADAMELGLADMYPRWRDIDSEALPDGLHPSDAAANAVIVPVLVDLLAQTLGTEACTKP